MRVIEILREFARSVPGVVEWSFSVEENELGKEIEIRGRLPVGKNTHVAAGFYASFVWAENESDAVPVFGVLAFPESWSFGYDETLFAGDESADRAMRELRVLSSAFSAAWAFDRSREITLPELVEAIEAVKRGDATVAVSP